MGLAAIWLVLMLGAFYVLLWRPQKRRIAMVRSLQSQLHEGDDVLTTSGIYGRVTRLGDDDIDLEIAPGTVIKIARGAIGQRLSNHDDDDTHEETRGGAHDDGAEAD